MQPQHTNRAVSAAPSTESPRDGHPGNPGQLSGGGLVVMPTSRHEGAGHPRIPRNPAESRSPRLQEAARARGAPRRAGGRWRPDPRRAEPLSPALPGALSWLKGCRQPRVQFSHLVRLFLEQGNIPCKPGTERSLGMGQKTPQSRNPELASTGEAASQWTGHNAPRTRRRLDWPFAGL